MSGAAPSKELIECTVQRGIAIENGRQAEKMLASGKELTHGEVVSCTAQGVVGRVMLNREMPQGVTAAQMAEQLAANAKFSDAVPQSAEKALAQIRSGNLIKKAAEPAKVQNKPEREVKSPVMGSEISL